MYTDARNWIHFYQWNLTLFLHLYDTTRNDTIRHAINTKYYWLLQGCYLRCLKKKPENVFNFTFHMMIHTYSCHTHCVYHVKIMSTTQNVCKVLRNCLYSLIHRLYRFDEDILCCANIIWNVLALLSRSLFA